MSVQITLTDEELDKLLKALKNLYAIGEFNKDLVRVNRKLVDAKMKRRQG